MKIDQISLIFLTNCSKNYFTFDGGSSSFYHRAFNFFSVIYYLHTLLQSLSSAYFTSWCLHIYNFYVFPWQKSVQVYRNSLVVCLQTIEHLAHVMLTCLQKRQPWKRAISSFRKVCNHVFSHCCLLVHLIRIKLTSNYKTHYQKLLCSANVAPNWTEVWEICWRILSMCVFFCILTIENSIRWIALFGCVKSKSGKRCSECIIICRWDDSKISWNDTTHMWNCRWLRAASIFLLHQWNTTKTTLSWLQIIWLIAYVDILLSHSYHRCIPFIPSIHTIMACTTSLWKWTSSHLWVRLNKQRVFLYHY